MKLKIGLALFIETFREWHKDNISHLSAALSYYTIFSLVPVLVICIAILSFLVEQNSIANTLITQVNQTLGVNAGATLSQLMENIRSPKTNMIAFILGVLILIWSAESLFNEIQYCFNIIWKVDPKSSHSWIKILKNRVYYFILIVGIGFILLGSLVVSASISTIIKNFYYILPHSPIILMIWDFTISVFFITFLFCVIFKILPNVILKWSDVALGAFITALLFNIGKFVLSIYLASSNIGTLYGAAASFILLLLWVYYTTQVILWGAEFCKVYAWRCGSLVPFATHMDDRWHPERSEKPRH